MSFFINEIPENLKQSMIHKRIWQETCPVGLNQLRLLQVDHYNFTGDVLNGEIVTHFRIAENVIKIFQELYRLKFPINKVRLIDDYDGNDELSMTDNNSSCFNYRNIPGSDILSIHSYGLAIDINPLQNPFIVINNNKNITVYPKEGALFLNRYNRRAGMVEPIVELFKNHGFDDWGGMWNDPIDYHHFQVNRIDAKNF
jgi:hypothetical protein